jgi:hypothetical protein
MSYSKKEEVRSVRRDPFILSPLIAEEKRIQQEAIIISRRWIYCLVVGGVAILLFAQIFSIAGPAATDLIKIGGLFIGTLAALPFREIAHRKERLAIYSFLHDQFKNFDSRSQKEKATLLALATDALREALKR